MFVLTLELLVVVEPFFILLHLAQLVVVLNGMAVIVVVLIAFVRLALLLEAGEDILSVYYVQIVLVEVILDERVEIFLFLLFLLLVFHQPASVILLHLTYNYKVKVNLISI